MVATLICAGIGGFLWLCYRFPETMKAIADGLGDVAEAVGDACSNIDFGDSSGGDSSSD